MQPGKGASNETETIICLSADAPRKSPARPRESCIMTLLRAYQNRMITSCRTLAKLDPDVFSRFVRLDTIEVELKGSPVEKKALCGNRQVNYLRRPT